MKVTISNNFKCNEVAAPASKSYAQRAILAATLCTGTSTVKNVGKSDDVEHIIEVARQLGAQVRGENNLRIAGKKALPKMTLNCGESGLGMRMTTMVAAAIGGEYNLIGEGSLMNRPMTGFAEILPMLGVEFQSINGFPPLHINGQLQGGIIEIDGSTSSQYLSGLLMAAPVAGQNSEINVKNLNSIPYVQMTLELLETFGIKVSQNNFETFKIKGNQVYQPCDYTVEGDWSGAAFWIVYGALKNKIVIKGLNPDSKQADKEMLTALSNAGGNYAWIGGQLTIEPGKLKAFEFDATHCPDLFPTLVLLAAGIKGCSKINGVERLKHKESDRATVLKHEFGKLGLDIQIIDNKMIINGNGQLKSGTIHANSDHRIAMAGAIAAILSDNEISIDNAEAVSKSYPEFWDIFQ